MTVLNGFDDLRPRDVLAWNQDGTVLIRQGEGLRKMQLQVGPTGGLSARDIAPTPVDQRQPPERVPVAVRWAGTDQGSAVT